MRHDRRACATAFGLVQIVVRVEVFTDQRHEQFARANAPRVRRHAFDLRQQQRQARPLAVIEGQFFTRDVLISFVPLARQQHHIFGRRRPDGLHDGARAVDLNVGIRRFGNAGQDLFDNRLGRLGTGVVAGHNDVVGQFRCDATHLRALAGVAFTAAPEQADQAA
ncbi:hypothetical protein D3C86_1259050 [compost metagenome]